MTIEVEAIPAQSIADDVTLDDSQRFTEASKGHQKNNGLVLAGLALTDQAIVSVTNFLTTVLIARLCTGRELGIYALAWTIINLVKTAQERAISAPYLVFVHRSETDAKSFLGSSLVHQMGFAMLSVVCISLLGCFFAWRGQPHGLALALSVLAVGAPFILLREHIRAVNSAHFRFHISLLMDASILLLQLGGILFLAYYQRLSIATAFVMIGVSCFLPVAIWYRSARSDFRFSRKLIGTHWSNNWNYSRWLVFARTLGIAGHFLLPWIIVLFMSESAAGKFASCVTLVGLSMMFVLGANNFFQARAVRDFHEGGLRKLYGSLTTALVVFVSVLSVISTIFFLKGDWLLSMVYGPDFASYGTVVFLLSLNVLLVSITIVVGNGLSALGRSSGFLIGESAYFVVTVSTAIFFTMNWQLVGAAWSLVCGGIAGVIAQTITLGVAFSREKNREVAANRT